MGALRVPGPRRRKNGRGRNILPENKEQPRRMDEGRLCYAFIETVTYERIP